MAAVTATSEHVWLRTKHAIKPNPEDTALSGLRDLQGISGPRGETVESHTRLIARLT